LRNASILLPQLSDLYRKRNDGGGDGNNNSSQSFFIYQLMHNRVDLKEY
jgi:hypothetical protein